MVRQYRLLCPPARKREDILSLGTLLCSAVDGHQEKTKRKTIETEAGSRSETERIISVDCV